MSEKYLLEAIKKKRTDAIRRADIAKAEQFTRNPKDNTNKIVAVLLVLFLSVSTIIILLAMTNPEPTKIIYHTEITREKPVIQKITHINRTENIIKAEQEMVCLGKPNSNKLTCYKEG
jgi:hypothetical protein